MRLIETTAAVAVAVAVAAAAAEYEAVEEAFITSKKLGPSPFAPYLQLFFLG